jgi:hypothetical protein
MILTFDTPYLLAAVGALYGAVVFQRRRRSTLGAFLGLVVGGLCGFCALLLPYLLLRTTGAYHAYYSQGRFGIELGEPAEGIPGAGWLYFETLSSFRQVDEMLCNRFLTAPSGG